MTTSIKTTTENKTTETEMEAKKPLPSIANAELPLDTLLKNTKEFSKLAGIHKAFLDKMANTPISDITGSTTIGNLLCISSGYAGGKYDVKKDPRSPFRFFAEQVNKSNDVSDAVKAILSAFAKADKNGKSRPNFDTLSAILDITQDDYTAAVEIA